MNDRIFQTSDMDREVPLPNNVIPIGKARGIKPACKQPAPPNPDAVKFLEDILDLAKKGQVVAVAIATVYSDRSTGTGFSLGDFTLNDLLAATVRLQSRIVEK